LAGCFAKGGFDLVLVARSADKLQALSEKISAEFKVKVWVEPSDLSKPGSAKKLSAALAKRDQAIDVLVNNAGVLEHGAFAAMGPERHQQMIDLNVAGLTDMLAHFIPPMVARRQGRVLNVASIAAFQPIPSLATYAATKAYVLSLTESLSEELKGTGVSITALCPGITGTAMVSNAAKGSPALAKLPEFLVSDVHEVAKDGYDACMRGDVIKVPGVLNLAAILAGRATPKWLLRSISGVLGRQSIPD
jgi:short-subunit dehydrogenase